MGARQIFLEVRTPVLVRVDLARRLRGRAAKKVLLPFSRDGVRRAIPNYLHPGGAAERLEVVLRLQVGRPIGIGEGDAIRRSAPRRSRDFETNVAQEVAPLQ